MDNKNVNQQPTNNTQTVPNTVAAPSAPVAPSAATTPAVPAAPSVANTTQPVAAAPSVPSTPVAPSAPVVPTGADKASAPVQPTEQRVQLIDDKPALKAISPNDVPKKEEVKEEKKEDETPKKEGSRFFQNLFLIILFGGLLAFIVFIEDITAFVEEKKYLKEQNVEVITTGTLKCSMEKNTNNLDYEYIADFQFRDSKLKRLTYKKEIRGDANLDEVALDTLNKDCLQVKEFGGAVSGIDVTCSLESGTFREKQVFTYDAIDREAAMSAYIEAGGIYPEYKKDQNIDEIEREMNAAGYSCERVK